ncbi:MAG: flagellar hook-associated protein 2 [Gammaproteobacteria bacterium]|nr:MAG: flagellar hook-associated protein 2 [Gammaproteobacteria bacterium]
MSTISSPGIGSGLDVDGIVRKLVEIERAPVLRLQARKADNEVRISGYGQIKNALADFKAQVERLSDPAALSRPVAASSDEAVFTASAGDGAGVARHQIEVVQLAGHHRLHSAAYADPGSPVGSGSLTIGVAGQSMTLTIDAASGTLEGIRDAINSAADNPGVEASVINVDGGSRLILRSTVAGSDGAIQVDVVDDDGDSNDAAGLSALAYNPTAQNLTELDAAQDALLRVDGFDVTVSGNTVSGVVPGVTLELKSTGSAELTVSRDRGEIQAALSALADSYNELRTTLDSLRETTLAGDNFLVTLDAQLREQLARTVIVDGQRRSVFEFGFSIDKDGVASFDAAKLDAALAADPEAVIDFFAGDAGFAQGMLDRLDAYLAVGGLIDGRTDGLAARNELLDQRIETLEARLADTEQRLLARFSALDGLISEMQATSRFVDQQLAGLNLFNRSR